MPYVKVYEEWEDAPSTATPITAEALSQIEQGLLEVTDLAELNRDNFTDHEHTISDVEGLQTALDDAAASGGGTAGTIDGGTPTSTYEVSIDGGTP